MSTLDIRIEGIGFWASGWPHWPAARAGLRGELQADPAVIKPSPGILVAAERRRAPLPVLLACEVATQACAESGHAVDSLASVFASTHGDLVITDYMCSTVASAPRELSPIKFHNSVHNAPAGYWHIATASRAPSTSLAAFDASFGAGLLEAAVQCLSSQAPVLLVACDLPYPAPLPASSSASVLQLGRQLALQGDAARQVPACVQCHGERMTGVLPATPGLLGLPRDYLNAQLGAWKAGQRHAQSPDCMKEVASRLSLQDINAAASWIAAQPLPTDTRPAASLPPPAPSHIDIACTNPATPPSTDAIEAKAKK